MRKQMILLSLNLDLGLLVKGQKEKANFKLALASILLKN